MFDKTVTIFNQSNGVWYPKVFTDVQVLTDRGYIRRTYGDTSNDSVIVHIPCKYEADGTAVFANGIEFLLPKEFDASPYKQTGVTFRSGNDFDIIYIGEYSTNAISDSDYQGGFFKYMKSTYDNVFATTNVAQFYVVPHFELTGR